MSAKSAKKAQQPLPRVRRAPPSAEKKHHDERLFSGSKIGRVLESKYNISMAQFVRDYDDDTSRSPRTRALDDSEIAAIKRFLTHKNVTQLANDLACSLSSAQGRVTRYVLDHMAAPAS